MRSTSAKYQPNNSTSVVNIDDRYVKCVFPGAGKVGMFSTFLDDSCVLLLGHAGAGKTSLFRNFNREEEGYLIDAARLLSIGAGTSFKGKTVYVDALDEQRAGDNLQESLVKVVRKLRELGASRIRVACRVADWYDSSALDIPLGDYIGDYQVLTLEPLTESQMLRMLQALDVVDPKGFLEQARQRGLDELLGIPQNLLMLQKFVVKRDGWPIGRHALYEGAVEELLSEHNKQRRHTPRTYEKSRLRSVSGGLCALRILSDMGGISLLPGEDEQFPYYKDIPLGVDDDAVMAALGLRVFVPVDNEIMDTSHRTVAEFLAAQWLADCISEGLPLGRVRALLGIDGMPASSLRGVHAWLAVMLDIQGPDEASQLITADPSGILIYSDGGKLRSATKWRLLQALAVKAVPSSEEYYSLLSELNLGRLSELELVPFLKEALSPKCKDIHLRTVVLDAVRLGEPLQELASELINILIDPNDPGREASLHALLKLPQPPYDLLAEIYTRLDVSEGELTLKVELLAGLYNRCLGTQDVLNLIELIHLTSNRIVLSKTPHLGIRVSDKDAPKLLDGLHEAWCNRPELAQSEAAFRVIGLIDASLVQVLERKENDASERLFGWLSLRYHYSGAGQFVSDSPDTVNALSKREDVLNGLADQSLLLIAKGTADFTRIMCLRDMSFGLMTAEILTDRAVTLLRTPDAKWDIESLYDAAMKLALACGESSAEHLGYLKGLAHSSPALTSIAEKNFALKKSQSVDKQVNLPVPNRRHDWLKETIEGNSDRIMDGERVDVLAHVSDLYFSTYAPHGIQKLQEQFGDHVLGIVIEGLRSFAERIDILPFSDVLELAVASRLPSSRFALAAAIDFARPTIPEELLPARLLAVSLLISQVRTQPGRFAPPTAGYSWLIDTCDRYPELAVKTFERLARTCLERGANSVDGLNRLCGNPSLLPFSAKAALNLLLDYPAVDEAKARILLPFVLSNQNGEENSRLLALMLKRTAEYSHGNGHLMWLAVAMILEPGRYDKTVADKVVSSPAGLLEALYLICSIPRLRPIGLEKLSVASIGSLLQLIVKYSSDGQLKDFTHHAHKLISILIELLETNSETAAGSLLEQLRGNLALEHFKARIEKALPRQLALAVDSHYQQFRWPQILTTLRNGPPRSVADLQALVMDHMTKIQADVLGSNFNFHKWFWSEDEHGRAIKEKCENSARDVLMGLLSYRLAHHGVDVQPEGSMRDSKRVDILLSYEGMKLVIELKRDSHADLRTAIPDQLDRYTRLPQASGRGIFGVFWFGNALSISPETLCDELRNSIVPGMSERIKVFVLDVSMQKINIKPSKAATKKSAASSS